MKQIIHNTIRIYCIPTIERARYIDFIVKNGCEILGSGMGERSMYVLVDANKYMPLAEKWIEKQQ